MARPEEKSAYGSEFSVYAHGHLGTSPPISPRSYDRLGAGDFAWRWEDRTAALREHSAPWVDDICGMLEDVTRKQVRLDETRRIADEKAAVLLRMFDDLREMANDTPREDLAIPPNMLTYSLHKAIADSPRAVAARTIREAPGPLAGHLAIHTRPKYARPPRVISVTPAAPAAGAPPATIAATPAPHSPRSPRAGRAAAAAAIPSTRASRMAARSWTGPAWAGAGGSAAAPLHRPPPQAPSAAAPHHRPPSQASSTAAPLHRPAPQQVDARGGCGGAGDNGGDGGSAAAAGTAVTALEGSGGGASSELGFALPASLERLIAQLHAADAAFLERLDETAVLEHMLARDAKLTELVRKGNNTDRREATLVATALKEAIARAHENLSSERRAVLALHEASKRCQRARDEHVARLQERAGRHQYGEWLSARLRTKPHLRAGASAALATPCTSSSSSSSSSVLSDPAHVAGEGAPTVALADLEALADDPALQTSRAYRCWYEVARRLQLPLDRLIALALERCEQLRWRDEAEARVQEARTRRAQLEARRSMAEQNRSDDEATQTQLGADEASQTERVAAGARKLMFTASESENLLLLEQPVTNSTKPDSENLLLLERPVTNSTKPESENLLLHTQRDQLERRLGLVERQSTRVRNDLLMLCQRANDAMAGLRHLAELASQWKHESTGMAGAAGVVGAPADEAPAASASARRARIAHMQASAPPAASGAIAAARRRPSAETVDAAAAAEELVGLPVDPELVHTSVQLAANAMEAMLCEFEAASAANPLAVGPTGRHALAMPATLRVGELRGTSNGSGPRPAPPLGTPSPRRVQTMGNVVAARRGSSTPAAAPPMRRRPTIGIGLRNESPGQTGKGIASAEEAPSMLLTVGTWTAYNAAPADGDEEEDDGSLRSNFKLNEEHRVEEKREAERRALLPKRPPPRPQPSYITKQTAASLAAVAERAAEAGSLEYQELKAAIRAGPQHRAPPRRPPHTAR
eukprot:jgi/Chrpa1/7815/Chrysochromulina_OHIO_Genome00016299-RA